MTSVPATSARIVIVGAGFAGASTAAALARAGAGPGFILEREPLPGAHASGKNAAIARQVEFDPIVRRLAAESLRRLRTMTAAGQPLVRAIGGLYLGQIRERERFAACADALVELGVEAAVLDSTSARARFPFLAGAAFDLAVHCAGDGVVDIHGLLLAYLDEARRGGFTLWSGTDVTDLVLESGRVAGVVTSKGTILADLVVDAGGAWAGRLGRPRPLPLRALRRHLFVSGETASVPGDAPLVWDVSAGYYFRPEGAGLLLSPCDESEQPAGEPPLDPAAADLLATKLIAGFPSLGDLGVRSSWACLRTFAADRRPVIGPDPAIGGLFHVSALGGFGVGASWAVGEIAAALVTGRPVPFVDAGDVAPARLP